MGLFDKKFCSVCGEKIGFLGNRKLEDGNLCKNCARKLSPFFRERRSSTVEEIRAQLAYREENQKALESFHPNLVYGEDEKIYLDLDAKKMIVTSASDFREDNPDIIDVAQIIACEADIEDNKEEIFFEDSQGNEKSYTPPRYSYAYEFRITFRIDSPWFDEITVDLNPESRPESKEDDLYAEWQMRVSELKTHIVRMNHIPTVRDTILGPIPGYFDKLREQQAQFGRMEPSPQETASETVPETNVPGQKAGLTEGVWKCAFCGSESSGKFCPECGAKQPEKDWQCPRCGSKNEGKFCAECGTPRT